MFFAETYFGKGSIAGNWMEEMLRRLDPVKPDYVLVPEADEIFPPNFENEDLKGFIESGADLMVALFDMPTFPERKVPIITQCHHCRGYKWYPGITYNGSKGFCWPAVDGERVYKLYKMKKNVLHFSLFTPTIEEEKARFYGKKAEYIWGTAGLKLPWEVSDE